jgi:hypothetical protein
MPKFQLDHRARNKLINNGSAGSIEAMGFYRADVGSA